MYCHFSVILSCKITMSQEITLFLTVETWTLIWSIILIFLGQGGGLGAVDPVRPELQKLIRVSLLKSKLCIRRIVLRNCHKQLRPHIRQVKCCYFIEKLCNQMWWILEDQNVRNFPYPVRIRWSRQPNLVPFSNYIYNRRCQKYPRHFVPIVRWSSATHTQHVF